MDKGDIGLTVLCLVLLCVCEVFGIPSISFLVYKSIRKPRVFVRFSSTLILAALGLVSCFVIVPAKVVEIVHRHMADGISKSFCIPVTSVSGFLEISQMISLCVLTISRSINVQALKRNQYLKTEAVSVCIGLTSGIGCCVFIGTGQYDGRTRDEAGLMCADSFNTVKMTHVSVFYIIRFILLLLTCMAMLGSWISMLRFLFLRAPKVLPFGTRYRAGNERPQLELIFAEEIQARGMEHAFQTGEETHSDQNPESNDNRDDALERCSSKAGFSNCVPLSVKALAHLKTGGVLAFSNIPTFQQNEDTGSIYSCSSSQMQTYLNNSKCRSMCLQPKKQLDHSVQLPSMLTPRLDRPQSKTGSFHEHVTPTINRQNCLSGCSLQQMPFQSANANNPSHDHCRSSISSNLSKDTDVNEGGCSEVMTERCNGEGRNLEPSVQLCFASQSDLDLDYDSRVCGKDTSLTPVTKFMSTASDISSDRSRARQGSSLGKNQRYGMECEFHETVEDDTANSSCVIKACPKTFNSQVERQPSGLPLQPAVGISSAGTDKYSRKNFTFSEPCSEQLRGTLTRNGSDVNEIKQDCAGSETFCLSVGNSGFGTPPSLQDNGSMPSPCNSTSTNFSFGSQRWLKMKKVVVKPILEMLVVLLLLLPDVIIKCPHIFYINGNVSALSPLTESMSLLLWTINPFIFIINNRTIMEAL